MEFHFVFHAKKYKKHFFGHGSDSHNSYENTCKESIVKKAKKSVKKKTKKKALTLFQIAR